MAKQKAPVFQALDRAACDAILARNHVARIAFIVDGQPDIEPISFVYADGWVYGRTAPGAKFEALQHHPWVAFEVDEVEGPTEWRSVVVHGTVYFTGQDVPGVEGKGYQTAVDHLRSIDPDVLDEDDIAPHRRLVFRLHCGLVTGRRATTRLGSQP